MVYGEGKIIQQQVECKGCLNIEGAHFPFGNTSSGHFGIDTEGCGFYEKDDYSWLYIHYCPVCGKELKEKDNAKH